MQPPFSRLPVTQALLQRGASEGLDLSLVVSCKDMPSVLSCITNNSANIRSLRIETQALSPYRFSLISRRSQDETAVKEGVHKLCLALCRDFPRLEHVEIDFSSQEPWSEALFAFQRRRDNVVSLPHQLFNAIGSFESPTPTTRLKKYVLRNVRLPDLMDSSFSSLTQFSFTSHVDLTVSDAYMITRALPRLERLALAYSRTVRQTFDTESRQSIMARTAEALRQCGENGEPSKHSGPKQIVLSHVAYDMSVLAFFISVGAEDIVVMTHANPRVYDFLPMSSLEGITLGISYLSLAFIPSAENNVKRARLNMKAEYSSSYVAAALEKLTQAVLSKSQSSLTFLAVHEHVWPTMWELKLHLPCLKTLRVYISCCHDFNLAHIAIFNGIHPADHAPLLSWPPCDTPSFKCLALDTLELVRSPRRKPQIIQGQPSIVTCTDSVLHHRRFARSTQYCTCLRNTISISLADVDRFVRAWMTFMPLPSFSKIQLRELEPIDQDIVTALNGLREVVPLVEFVSEPADYDVYLLVPGDSYRADQASIFERLDGADSMKGESRSRHTRLLSKPLPV